jgi:hypothetical protein
MAINLMDQVRRFRRARQTFLPAQVLQAAGKGLQFGLMGKVPTDDETDMRGPQMEALQSQLESVTELSKQAMGDPVKMAEARQKAFKTAIDAAIKDLNNKRTTMTQASFNQKKLELMAMKDKLAAIDRNLKTVDPQTRGSGRGSGAEGVNMEKVNNTFYRVAAKLTGSPTEEATPDVLMATISSGKLNEAEEAALFDRMKDSSRFRDTVTQLPGARESSTSAFNRLTSLGSEMGTDAAGFVDSLQNQFAQDRALAAQVAGSADPSSALASVPDPGLRQRVEELTFARDEASGKLLVDEEGRPVLSKDAAAAAEYSASVQGIERQHAEMMDRIQRGVGPGRGNIAEHFQGVIGVTGASSLPDYFAALGLGDMSEQQAAQAQALTAERQKLGQELTYAATRPTGLQGMKADIYRNPEFAAFRQQTGLSERDALQTLARIDRGKQREERQSRSDRRKALAEPRVTAALKKALYGAQGPQDV